MRFKSCFASVGGWPEKYLLKYPKTSISFSRSFLIVLYQISSSFDLSISCFPECARGWVQISPDPTSWFFRKCEGKTAFFMISSLREALSEGK